MLSWYPEWRCQNYATGGCPYCAQDIRNGRHVIGERPAGRLQQPDQEQLILFFRRNLRHLLGHVDIVGGGEPTLNKAASSIVRSLPAYQYSMTSNTQSPVAVDRWVSMGCHRCTHWTASYHPLAHQQEPFAGNIRALQLAGFSVSSTVIVSRDTIGLLEDTMAFLRSLRLPVHFHKSVQYEPPPGYGREEDDWALTKTRAESIAPGVPWVAGDVPPVPRCCHKHTRHLALSPDGYVFPCTSLCSYNQGAICQATADTDLAALPDVVSECTMPCFCPREWEKWSRK